SASDISEALPIISVGKNIGVTSGATASATSSHGGAVPLTARGDGVYTGAVVPTAAGSISVTFSVTVSGVTKTKTISGTAQQNYAAVDAPYSWVDASAGGTQVSLAMDDGSANVTLPFSFSFYGTPH